MKRPSKIFSLAVFRRILSKSKGPLLYFQQPLVDGTAICDCFYLTEASRPMFEFCHKKRTTP